MGIMSRPLIAVDIDDVLAAHAEVMVNFSNTRWGHNLKPDDYDEDLASMWGVSVKEALRRVDELLASGVHAGLRHYKEAIPVLLGLQRRFELVAVTSRRISRKAVTDIWIERYFPGIFKEIVFAGIFDNFEELDAQHRLRHTKAELLTSIGASYLIDDQPKHCIGAAKAGITALLFGDYAWNRKLAGLPQGVVRLHTWKDVERYF